MENHIDDMLSRNRSAGITSSLRKIACSTECYTAINEKMEEYFTWDLSKEGVDAARFFVEKWEKDNTRIPSTGRKIATRHTGVKSQMEYCYRKYKKVLHYASHPEELAKVKDYRLQARNAMTEAERVEQMYVDEEETDTEFEFDEEDDIV